MCGWISFIEYTMRSTVFPYNRLKHTKNIKIKTKHCIEYVTIVHILLSSKIQ